MEDTIIDDSKKFKFSEEYIQRKLNGFFAISTQKYVLENLYIFSWESDKFIETRSGLIYEFEIKISRSDYKNDFKKEDKHVILEGKEKYIPSVKKLDEFTWWTDDFKEERKKYYLTENHKKPNYFYYAVPEGMISVDEVPDYAGLIYVLPDSGKGWVNKDGHWCGCGFYIVKKAPKLHDKHYTDDELSLSEKFYYNMLSWKDKCQIEKERRLITEDDDHKIPYAELMEKYEKLQKEYNAMKVLVDSEAKTNKFLAETMEQDRKIIRGYQVKLREMDPEFDFIKFEDEFLEDYK